MSNKMISLFSIGKTQQIGQQTTNNYGLDEEAMKAIIDNAVQELSQKLHGVEKNNEALVEGVQNALFKQIFELKEGQTDIREAVRKNFEHLEANQTAFASQIIETINGLIKPTESIEKALQSFCEQSERAANAQYEQFMALQEKQIENARKNLNRETSREHPNKDNVKKCALALLEVDPDDFLARFYLAAYSENYRDAITFLNETNVGEHTQEELKEVIGHLTKHLRSEWILSASALVERSSSVLGKDENSFRKEFIFDRMFKKTKNFC